ncbi:hypothetical protein JKP88DRAFT_243445 [Tribonema minus]|uniref:Uncharacterized protein n=1 Tax=Tribonema minus TaxID=303371 RepID=A0A836CK72_9STRA|nr:hypothetical protein JKP88DRAFT_243445 [Tribonema minus]
MCVSIHCTNTARRRAYGARPDNGSRIKSDDVSDDGGSACDTEAPPPLAMALAAASATTPAMAPATPALLMMMAIRLWVMTAHLLSTQTLSYLQCGERARLSSVMARDGYECPREGKCPIAKQLAAWHIPHDEAALGHRTCCLGTIKSTAMCNMGVLQVVPHSPDVAGAGDILMRSEANTDHPYYLCAQLGMHMHRTGKLRVKYTNRDKYSYEPGSQWEKTADKDDDCLAELLECMIVEARPLLRGYSSYH